MYLDVPGCTRLYLAVPALVYHGLPWSVSDHNRMLFNAQTYVKLGWMVLGMNL